MYPAFLMIHSVLRWLVLVAAVAAAGKALAGWLGKQPLTKLDDRLGLIFTITMDAQLLVGLILYVFLSPLTQSAFQNMDAAMSDITLRFFVVEHLGLMVVAVVLTHIGRALTRRAPEAGKHRRAALWYGLALLVILFAIPWPFYAYGRPLNPFWMLGG
ncbi:MAG: hypothetical protein NZM11_05900 [Anaerolineales bacterium]|nr:hypothetical protein [Anaerolineales bacterium]